MKKTLVFDLDKILIHSDMLCETFWSVFSMDWKISLKSFGWFFLGKANLKYKFSCTLDVNIKNLTYDKNIINYIKQNHKKSGHNSTLTASNQTIAEKISKHFILFDQVKGLSKKLIQNENILSLNQDKI